MNISIITCTYNPDERILSRVLDAVAKLVLPANSRVEYLIIDNNSKPPLAEASYVRQFLGNISWSKLIVETQQGLSYSRLKGFNESTGDIIVFFDDDNVADPNYLIEVQQLFNNNVQVGIWGPGNIEVVYMDPVSEWMERNTRGFFQEKRKDSLEFGYSLNPSSFHPFGTGMILKKDILEFYYQQYTKGNFTTTDRKGDSLASGGDTQLIFAAYKMGLATGVAPGMKMKHLIPGKRITVNYLCKLCYGIEVTNDSAIIESFPDFKDIVLTSSKSLLKKLIKRTLSLSALRDKKKYKIEIAGYMGNAIGKYRALKVTEPHWMTALVKYLNLE